MIIRNIEGDELDKLLVLLNYEFVISKNRSTPMQKRFPGLYEKHNINNLFVIENNKEILSFIAIKTVVVNYPDIKYKAFFIGSVFTPEKHRNRGYSSILLKNVQEKYLNRGFAFGVLWTGHHSLYEKIGWKLFDNGILLRCEQLKCPPVVSKNIKSFEINKNEQTSKYIKIRKKYNQIDSHHTFQNDFYTIYGSAEKSFNLIIKENENISMINGGLNNEDIFIYEINRNEAMNIKDILNSLVSHFPHKNLLINTTLNTPIISLLKGMYNKIEISTQQMTMFLYNTYDNFNLERINKLYIPFSSRI